jgi:CubicO group peptidase (beta-lactamase class C family)
MRDLGLFTGISQSENFSNLKHLVPVREMPAASNPRPWPVGAPIELPEAFAVHGAHRSVHEFLARTATSALLVIRDGEIRYENYWAPGARQVQWLSMSVAKSFTSALVGAAVADGAIRSIDDAISDYLTVEPGSAYDGVSIRDVLLMSSGARWNEDYSDPSSDAKSLMDATAGDGGNLEHFVAHLVKDFEPGTVCQYNSGDTQALGLLIRAATGRSISDYMQTKLIEPLGFEDPGYWLLDASGTELAFGGLNLTARDFARIGELYVRGGEWHGTQVIDEAWVRDSVRVTADHCVLEAEDGFPATGYGYQWWLPRGEENVFSAIGVYNQFVYVNPATRTTIVKLSANPTYGLSVSEDDNLEEANLALLNTISSLDF